MKFRRHRGRRDDGASAALAGLASATAALREVPAAAAGDAAAALAEGPQVAAFFDVDGTMVAGASIYYFARGLAARHFFTTRDVLAFVAKQLTFRLVGRESHTGMAEARETALAFVAGRKVADIVAFGEEIYDEAIADKIFGGTLALAQQHLEAGHQVWLVTATPVELASLIARRLGLTGALGTVAASEDGVYTGRLVGVPLHGPAKAEAVQALAQREGLDLSRCSAYSDSCNDLPMLSQVGHPMAINADAELRAHAREHDWPVKEFRTGRKAARVGVPAAGGVGVVAGAVFAGLALRRRVTG